MTTNAEEQLTKMTLFTTGQSLPETVRSSVHKTRRIRLNVKNHNNVEERRRFLAGLGKAFVTACFWSFWPQRKAGAEEHKPHTGPVMKLPAAATQGAMAVEQAIAQRRTVRSYLPENLSLEQLAQLLWAAQGVTDKSRFYRSAPSAGALYPMDIYVVAGHGSVTRIDVGVYHYETREHALSQLAKKDVRVDVARAALSQMWIAKAPVTFIITAEYKRVSIKYGKRGERYAMIEAGHIGQNLFLQAEALGLKAGIVGAFHDVEINRLLNLPRAHEPLLIMPAGYAAEVFLPGQ